MNSRIWPIDYKPMGHTFIVNTLRVVMPDLIRHPVFLMDVACASEDTGACALQGTRALIGYSPE
jgi:hypothetical protein